MFVVSTKQFTAKACDIKEERMHDVKYESGVYKARVEGLKDREAFLVVLQARQCTQATVKA